MRPLKWHIIIWSIITLIIIITSCDMTPEQQQKIQECIDYANTDTLNYDTLDGCKLWVCMTDNNLQNVNTIDESKMTACRSLILQDENKLKLAYNRTSLNTTINKSWDDDWIISGVNISTTPNILDWTTYTYEELVEFRGELNKEIATRIKNREHIK